MTKRKNHHYVPRFYLKRFSINDEGKVIGLYNHKNNIFVQNAPLNRVFFEQKFDTILEFYSIILYI